MFARRFSSSANANATREGLSRGLVYIGLFAGGYVAGTQLGVLPSPSSLWRQLGFKSAAIAKPDNLQITQRVYFDIGIDHKPAGRVVMGLYGELQPKTVASFEAICSGNNPKNLHYQNSIFHRIIPNFMIQGGDITHGTGVGGESIYGRNFPDEDLTVPHMGAGTLSMANAGRNTNGSQFFITLADTDWLNGSHVVFGRVLSGMEVVNKIATYGTSSGKPKADIRILKSGVLSLENEQSQEQSQEQQHNQKKEETEHDLNERLLSLRDVQQDMKGKAGKLDEQLYTQLMKDLEEEKKRVKLELKKIAEQKKK